MTPSLIATLAAVARAMAGARERWWIIGSAAVALHGCVTAVADVDLLVAEGDVAALLERVQVEPLALPPDRLFRSRCFARWDALPIAVEIMAGFCIAEGDGWAPVGPRSRQAFAVGGPTVFAPERAELIALLDRFGRPKDRARAAVLRGVRSG